MTILSLCDSTGEWSRPYAEAGYDVRQVDLRHGEDVVLFEALPHPVPVLGEDAIAAAYKGARYDRHRKARIEP